MIVGPDSTSDLGASGAGQHSRASRGMHRKRRDGLAREGGSAALVAYFKERVYATFTGLAIVLVVAGSDEPDPRHALLALVLGVLGITVAGFVSELIAHLVVHGSFSGSHEVIVPARVSLTAFGTVVFPALVIGAAALGWMPLWLALDLAAWIYVVTLAVIGLLAVRRAKLRWWQTVIALALLVGLGVLVLVLQTLAHSI